jgi:hypothetical protein
MRTRHLSLVCATVGMTAIWAQAQPAVPSAPPAATNFFRATALVPPVATNVVGPKIQFAKSNYNFGRAKAGEIVQCTYVFTNVGDQVLEVTAVQPGCGCTTAGDWTKKVEPGKIGNIPIQFNTAAYPGEVSKGITVTTTDPSQKTLVLLLTGTVWKPIEVVPVYPVLNIGADAATGSTVVQITNNMEQAVAIFLPEGNPAGYTFSLKTNQPGKRYELTITALPPLSPGGIASKVTLKTSAADTPVLEIPFTAYVTPAVAVSPPQVVIPQAQPSNPSTVAITVYCNSTNLLTLSEATVNAAGVGVQVNTMQPNKLYSVQLTFPAGFQIPPSQQVKFTAKTSLPQYPLITVPVIQMQPQPPPPSPQASAPPGQVPISAVAPPAPPGPPANR